MGKVYLVGAGPGAPDLLTLRAARILASADVVLHDALVHPDTLKLAVKARFIDVGKRHGKISAEQRFIHRALIEAARAHDVVVRLKGGDPMMFGRAQEELEALAAAGIETEVVPGVTAALAAASTLNDRRRQAPIDSGGAGGKRHAPGRAPQRHHARRPGASRPSPRRGTRRRVRGRSVPRRRARTADPTSVRRTIE